MRLFGGFSTTMSEKNGEKTTMTASGDPIIPLGLVYNSNREAKHVQ